MGSARRSLSWYESPFWDNAPELRATLHGFGGTLLKSSYLWFITVQFLIVPPEITSTNEIRGTRARLSNCNSSRLYWAFRVDPRMVGSYLWRILESGAYGACQASNYGYHHVLRTMYLNEFSVCSRLTYNAKHLPGESAYHSITNEFTKS
jgi:hypothetical protein